MGWLTSTQIYDKMQSLPTTYPNLCQYNQFGLATTNGKQMHYIRIPHSRRAGMPDTALGVLITAGVLGNETMGPEALLDFATAYLDIVTAISAIPAIPGDTEVFHKHHYYLYAVKARLILQYLDLYIVPLVNPDGRDYHIDNANKFNTGRKNRNDAVAAGQTKAIDNPPFSWKGTCINRNFDIMWKFESKFATKSRTDLSYAINYGLGRVPGSQDYCGASAESEAETQNVARLIRDRESITFLFDVHGHMGGSTNDVTYPWGWANNQSILPDQCFNNSIHDNRRTGTYLNPYREGDQTKYGEYMDREWLHGDLGLLPIAWEFAFAAMRSSPNQRSWTTKQSAQGFAYTGSIDDYFMSIDREHMRAFTIECTDLQPPPADFNLQKLGVTAGMLAALSHIAVFMDKPRLMAQDPRTVYGRHTPTNRPCPP